MAVVRRRNGEKITLREPEAASVVRTLAYPLYTYVLADDIKACSLLSIAQSPQTPEQINAVLNQVNPEFAKKRADELERTLLVPLYKSGALVVNAEKGMNTYRISNLGRDLFCPIIVHTLLWLIHNSDRCMRNYLGKYIGSGVSTPYQRADLIRVIGSLIQQLGEGIEISLDAICEKAEFSDSSNQGMVHKKNYFLTHLHHLEDLGLLKGTISDKTSLYQWKKEELFYPPVDYVDREYVKNVVQFLFERRHGQPMNPKDVKTSVQPVHRIWIYHTLDKLASTGHVEKTELPGETAVTPLEPFREFYGLFRQINQAVEEYILHKPNVLDTMKREYTDFQMKVEKSRRVFNEITRRYQRAVGT